MLGAILGLAGTVASSLIGSRSSAKGQKAANEQNIALQREQQAWEEKMSGSEFSRRIQDIRSAGMNPMLAYGGQASTPNVAPARVENEEGQTAEWAGHATSAFSALTQRKLADQQLENMKAEQINTASQTALNAELARKASADAAMSTASAGNLLEQRENIAQEYDRIQWEIDKLQKEVAGKDIDNKHRQKLNELIEQREQLEVYGLQLGVPALEAESGASSSWFGQKIRPYLGDATRLIGGAAQATGAVSAIRGAAALEKANEIRERGAANPRGADGRYKSRRK